MPSAKELRDELRALKASHPDHKAVSKMAKADVSALIERMKKHSDPKDVSTSVKPVKASPSAEKKKKVVVPESESESEEEMEAPVAKVKKEVKEVKAKAKAPDTDVKHVKDVKPKEDKMAAVRAAKGKKKE